MNKRPYQKQKVQLKVDVIECRLVEIKNIFCARQTRFRSKEYLVKYKGCHHKEVVWMKPAHLDHLPKMVKKFDHERGQEFGVKRIQKEKRHKLASGLSVDEDINI
jgi:hypothetical protein